MSERYKHTREIVARGMEHIVERSRNRDNLLYKRPRRFNRATFLLRDPVEMLQQEIAASQELIENTEIRIPPTEVRKTDYPLCGGVIRLKGYVIEQEEIVEDGSIVDKKQHLVGQGIETLLDEYEHEPRNFVSNGGAVYWVDPTRGTVGRILERTGVMPVERYRKIRRKMSKVIRFFGL